MARRIIFFFTIAVILIFAGPPRSFAVSDDIPAKVVSGHWSCRAIADLAAKYNVLQAVPEGASATKKELAAKLYAVLEKVLEKCDKEGSDGIPMEDLEQIARLHEALKEELLQYEGYLTRREAIAKILARPEEAKPPFEYSIGVGGFLRAEGVGNFRLTDFSYTPGRGEGRILYRVKPFAYWHPADWLDIHAEGQGYGYDGGGHQGRHKFSLYQGFVEVKTPDRDWLSLKGGRQEFSYGSTFILGPNSFYDGLAFDAVRLRVKPVDQLNLDLLLGAYAAPFNNGMEGHLAGIYATYSPSEGAVAEGYVFRDSGSSDHHVGEHLYVGGGRGKARIKSVSVEAELAYESGKLFSEETGGNDSISAFGGHLDVTYESVVAGYNNNWFLSYAYGSGSRDAANGVRANREFRNPNNDTPLMGDMGFIGDLSGLSVGDHHASGLHIYTLGWGIDITKALNFTATGHYFVADKVESGFSRRLGLETDFTVTYAVTDALSVLVGYDHFFTDTFFREAASSNSDIHYGYVMLQFNLEKSKPRLKKVGG